MDDSDGLNSDGFWLISIALELERSVLHVGYQLVGTDHCVGELVGTDHFFIMNKVLAN